MVRCHRSCVTWVLAAAMMITAGACAGHDSTSSPPSTETTPATVPPATSPATSGTTVAPTTTGDGARVVEVTYAGGQVVGGAQRVTVRLGDRVRLRVTSDVDDVVHLHTYDIKAAVTPDRPALLELVASIPGRHEVELDKKRRELLVLEVR